jgi:hypothetical protein
MKSREHSPIADASPTRRTRPWGILSLLLFLFFLSVYGLTMTGRVRFGDEGERYLTAQSLVERRDLAIRVQPGLHRKIGVDGRNYSSYELGSILPLVPFSTAGAFASPFFPVDDPEWVKMLIAGWFNPVVTALTAVLLFRFLLALGNPCGVSLGVTALFGLGTIAWPYSKAFEREPVLALGLLLAVGAAFEFRQTARSGWVWAAGASLGFLLFAKIANVILVPFFVIYLATALFTRGGLSLRRVWSASIALALPIGLPVGFQALSNQVRFGSWTDVGLAGVWGNPLSYFGFSAVGTALGGMFFSPAKSLFLYSLPILLFLPASIAFFKQRRGEALLILSLIVSTLLFNAMNINWDQPSWWGPKYLVPLTPLFLVPVGALFTASQGLARRIWSWLAAFAGLAGMGVQIIAGLVDDREYLDVTGRGIDLAGAVDFLRHGGLDSLVLSLSPRANFIQISPYGIVLVLCALFLGALIGWGRLSARWGALWSGLALSVEIGAFMLWIVAPFPQVRAYSGDTKLVAGNHLMEEGRNCEAARLYAVALDRGTNYAREAAQQIGVLQPRAAGTNLPMEDSPMWTWAPEGTRTEKDAQVTLTGGGSIRFSAPPGRNEDVTLSTRPLKVRPDVEYEIAGWIRGAALDGEGYAVISVVEHDGEWGHGRTTDVGSMDGTHGWRAVQARITTLPTTKRLILNVGLYNTHGTFWVDGITLTEIDPSARQSVPSRGPFPDR